MLEMGGHINLINRSIIKPSIEQFIFKFPDRFLMTICLTLTAIGRKLPRLLLEGSRINKVGLNTKKVLP